MKKILYSLMALLLFSVNSFAQLMSDADHRTMISGFASNVNTVLLTECPQGMTLDQFKKNIVLGTNTLSTAAQNNLLTYAAPLLTYANQFKTANNLTTENDGQSYFLSSFAPSTTIQNGKLVESTTSPSLTATDMWKCAISSFNTGGNCGIAALVGNVSDIKSITKAGTTFLVSNAGVTGVLVMLNGFNDCLLYSTYKNLMRDAFNQSVTLAFDNIVTVNNSYYINKNSFITGVVTVMNEKLNDNFQISDMDVFADDFNPNLSDVINDIDSLAYLSQEQKIIFKDFAYAIDNAASDAEVLNITSNFSRSVAGSGDLNGPEKADLQNIFASVDVIIELVNKNPNPYTDSAARWNGGVDLSHCKLPNGRYAAAAGVANAIRGGIKGCIAAAAGGCIHGAAVGAATGFVYGFGSYCAVSLASSCFGIDLEGWF